MADEKPMEGLPPHAEWHHTITYVSESDKADAVRHVALRGLMVNSALYLFMVFFAGLGVQSPIVWCGAIIAAALCYLNYYALALRLWAPLIWLLALASILVGAGAGILLLFRV